MVCCSSKFVEAWICFPKPSWSKLELELGWEFDFGGTWFNDTTLDYLVEIGLSNEMTIMSSNVLCFCMFDKLNIDSSNTTSLVMKIFLVFMSKHW
jgi:hypothetical protein